MSIYASNRMGSVSTMTAVANEAYGSNDIGQILYESQVNDQALFEAIVLSDLRELKGLQEGTLLESEVYALNEASIKGFFENIWKRLKAFWEKVKGVFKSIIAKIALFVAGDGKKFVKLFNENFDTSKKFKITGCKIAKTNMAEYFYYPEVDFIKKKIEAQKNEEKLDKKAIISERLTYSLKGGNNFSGEVTPKAFRVEAKKRVFGDGMTITNGTDPLIKLMLETVGAGRKTITDLRKQEKEIEKGIRNAGKEIKAAEKLALGMSPTKEEKKDNRHVVRNISALVSIYEQVTSIVMGAAISCAKMNLKNSYKILNKVLHLSNGSTESVTESAVIEAEEKVEEELNKTEEEVEKDLEAADETVKEEIQEALESEADDVI